MSAGHWHAPWHGNFEMTPDDLAEMVTHFADGVGMVQGSNKLPINYGHDLSGKAAGWITALRTESGGNELWADVEWTPYGTQMLADAEFRYISPEWNPRSFPYQDPEDEDLWLNNVFTGAGLTNIPLFKKLKPIMASRVTGSSEKPSNKQGDAMDLKEVRAKKPDELTEDEKTFLHEHKAELTDDERTTFGLVDADADANAKVDADAAAKAQADKDAADAAAAEETASGQQASAGVPGLSAAQVAQLRADAAAGRAASQELLRTRLTASVDTAIKRGAIRSDQLTPTVDLLMASSEGQRDKLTAWIEALPTHPILASEQGDGGTSSDQSAQDELNKRAAKLVADSGGKLSYSDAVVGAMQTDSALRDRVTAERKQQ
jgi:phage I-like protein